MNKDKLFSNKAREVYPDDYGEMINTSRDIKMLRSGFVRGAEFGNSIDISMKVFKFRDKDDFGNVFAFVAAPSLPQAQTVAYEENPSMEFIGLIKDISYTGDSINPLVMFSYYVSH